MKDHGDRVAIGSVTSPIKKALVEMLAAGALVRRRRPQMFLSINGAAFYDRTAIAMVKKNLAILSAADNMKGDQFLSLTEIGRYVAQAVLAEQKYRTNVEAALAPKPTVRERSGAMLEEVFAK
jgi:hypothetical protein